MKRHCFILNSIVFLSFVWFPCHSQIRESDTFIFHEPSSCSHFSNNETFSITAMGCVKCNWALGNIYENGVCPCPVRHRVSRELLEGLNLVESIALDRCKPCPNNSAVYDEVNCIQCPEDFPYDTTTGKCKVCPIGHIEVPFHQDGSPKPVSECLRCADGYTPNAKGLECVPCHWSFHDSANGTCHCPEFTHAIIQDICLPNVDLRKEPSLQMIDKKSVSEVFFETIRVESLYLSKHIISSYYLCRDMNNETACQFIANACSLNLHSFNPEFTVCRLYRTLSDTVNKPKLYYAEVGAPAVLNKATLIPNQYDMDFTQRSSDINITVSRISLQGQFLGLTTLTDILPCRDQPMIHRISQKFGTTFRTKCSVPISELWSQYQNKMEFFDAYVSQEDKGQMNLYSIPLKILEFKHDGVKSNLLEDKYQWQLVRRFFIVDTVGGIDAVERRENRAKTPRVVRYLSEISISISLQNSDEAGRIYVPLMTLSYKEMSQEDFLNNKKIDFSYSVNYLMDMSRSLEDVKISIGVISALTFVWAALQTWSWNRRSGQAEIDIQTVGNLFITSCGNLADAFFIVCFCTAQYWFIFFKQQVFVHVMLPQPDQERLIRDLLITAFALKIVDMIKLIWRQVTVDIFFVDWERPRARNTIQPPNEAVRHKIKNESGPGKLGDSSNVSIWRTYFIANEWNEIQSIRKIHVALQIIISLFLLEILGFKFWGLFWPNGTTSPGPESSHVPYSTSARFAVGSLVFGLVGICQWIYRSILHERFIENKIQDFVDVCTLSNISVFILAAKQHGYYIHGRSVHGFADTDMQTMIEQLTREEEDLCGRRGLLPSTDQQTFLISVPSTFRSVYNQVLQPLYASSNVQANLMGKGRLGTGGPASKTSLNTKPSVSMINLSTHAYHSMNRFLTAFLEHALSDLDYDVTDKSFFESTLDMEFNEVTTDRAVFYTDNGHSFDSVLFYGNERTIFMFNLYTFIFVDLLAHDYVLAGIITYIVDQVFKRTRNFFGKRNLARKTLIDSRFLI